MAMSYYKTFRVPFWVILDKTGKSESILEWFKNAEAKNQEWPAIGFDKTLEEQKKKGWAHVFEEKNVIIPPQLLAKSVGEHVNEVMSPFARFDYNALHRIDRSYEKTSDCTRMFNDIIAVQDSLILSQAFKVAETCFDESKAVRPMLWITEGPCERSVISKIADRVITIGNGAGFDLNIKQVKEDKMDEFLSKKMVEIYKK